MRGADRTSSALHKEAALYRTLVQTSPVPLLACTEGRVLVVNTALLELLGASESQLLDQPPLSFVHAESQGAARDRLGHALSQETPTVGRETWVRLDNSTVEVEVSRVAVPDAPEPTVQVILRELSQRRHLEHSLRQLETQLHAVTENVTDFAIFTLDVFGRVASWNKGAEGLFRYSAAEILAQPFDELFTLEDRAAGAPEWEKNEAAEKGLARDERWHLAKGGARRYLSGLLVAGRDSSGRLAGYIKVAQDRTDQKLAQDALQRSEEKHRQLAVDLEERVRERTNHLQQSVDTWESFCYSMAHDLRAPLRTISGFAQALLDDYAARLDPTAEEYAQRMMAAAQRLDEFIHDLLEFGRLAHADLPHRDLSLEDTIRDVLAELSREIAARGADVQMLGHFPRVSVNPAALNQVLTNLISNALKFVTPGSAPRIELRAERRGNMVRLWVKDHGIGIDPEHQDRVFHLFERLHPTSIYPGTGVGLAIVRKALERMGGRVGVESSPGAGSAFWIELPETVTLA
jgi:PAS domain S-box-containing protein